MLTLTPQQEDVLNRLIQAHSPLEPVNPNPGQEKITESQFLNWLVRTAPVGPMRVVSGPTEGGNQPLDTTGHVNGDSAVINRVRHVLRWIKEPKGNRVVERQEFLSEFYSRTGLGKSQILQMSKADITRFVEIAERNNQDVFEPVSYVFDEKPEAAPAVRFIEVGN